MEAITSCILYIARHLVWSRAHPDYVFLAYFMRTHVTVSLSIALILGPKVKYDDTKIILVYNYNFRD